MESAFVQIVEPKYNTKLFHIFKHSTSNSYIIKGRTCDGNDYIIDNADLILNNTFDIETSKDQLIWLHGNGPSPHFILYKDDTSYPTVDEINLFVKKNCPKKSNKGEKLSTCYLKDVTKTKTPGLVTIISKPLKKLLE